MNSKRPRSKLNVLIVCAVMLSFLLPNLSTVPAFAAQLDERALDFSAAKTLPVVDSALGVGKKLTTDPEAIVPVDLANNQNAVLARISVYNAQADNKIFAAGEFVMKVNQGASTSTTTLLKVKNGGVNIYASTETDVRVEVLATFESNESIPGSIIALDKAVTRAQTQQDLAGQSVNTTGDMQVGVVGSGGIPVTNVRSVFFTAEVTATSSNQSIVISGANYPLNAGTNLISTMGVPDDNGNLQLHLVNDDNADGQKKASLELRVHGYVVGADMGDIAVNSKGSFEPDIRSNTSQIALKAGVPSDFSLDTVSDAQSSLFIVSALPGGSGGSKVDSLIADEDHLTTVAFGSDVNIREQGAVYDPLMGISPQIMLLNSWQKAQILAHNADINLQIAHIGDIIGDKPTSNPLESAINTPDIQITSPTQDSSIDWADSRGLLLEGTVKQTSFSLNAVDVLQNNENLGNARVKYQSDGTVKWEIRLMPPTSGKYDFIVRAFDRSGAFSTKTLSVDVTMPKSEDLVVRPETVVLDSSASITRCKGKPLILKVTEDTLTMCSVEGIVPGSIITSDIAPNAPTGLLRKVLSIDYLSTDYLVHTENATLQDALLQGEYNNNTDVTNQLTDEDMKKVLDTPVDLKDDDGNVIATGIKPTNATLIDDTTDSIKHKDEISDEADKQTNCNNDGELLQKNGNNNDDTDCSKYVDKSKAYVEKPGDNITQSSEQNSDAPDPLTPKDNDHSSVTPAPTTDDDEEVDKPVATQNAKPQSNKTTPDKSLGNSDMYSANNALYKSGDSNSPASFSKIIRSASLRTAGGSVGKTIDLTFKIPIKFNTNGNLDIGNGFFPASGKDKPTPAQQAAPYKDLFRSAAQMGNSASGKGCPDGCEPEGKINASLTITIERRMQLKVYFEASISAKIKWTWKFWEIKISFNVTVAQSTEQTTTTTYDFQIAITYSFSIDFFKFNARFTFMILIIPVVITMDFVIEGKLTLTILAYAGFSKTEYDYKRNGTKFGTDGTTPIKETKSSSPDPVFSGAVILVSAKFSIGFIVTVALYDFAGVSIGLDFGFTFTIKLAIFVPLGSSSVKVSGTFSIDFDITLSISFFLRVPIVHKPSLSHTWNFTLFSANIYSVTFTQTVPKYYPGTADITVSTGASNGQKKLYNTLWQVTRENGVGQWEPLDIASVSSADNDEMWSDNVEFEGPSVEKYPTSGSWCTAPIIQCTNPITGDIELSNVSAGDDGVAYAPKGSLSVNEFRRLYNEEVEKAPAVKLYKPSNYLTYFIGDETDIKFGDCKTSTCVLKNSGNTFDGLTNIGQLGLIATDIAGHFKLNYLNKGNYRVEPVLLPDGYISSDTYNFTVGDWAKTKGSEKATLDIKLGYTARATQDTTVQNLSRGKSGAVDENLPASERIVTKKGDILQYTTVIDYPAATEASILGQTAGGVDSIYTPRLDIDWSAADGLTPDNTLKYCLDQTKIQTQCDVAGGLLTGTHSTYNLGGFGADGTVYELNPGSKYTITYNATVNADNYNLVKPVFTFDLSPARNGFMPPNVTPTYIKTTSAALNNTASISSNPGQMNVRAITANTYPIAPVSGMQFQLYRTIDGAGVPQRVSNTASADLFSEQASSNSVINPNSSNSAGVCGNTADGTAEPCAPTHDEYSLTTDALGQIRVDYFEPGDYYLMETSAPAGYKVSTEPIPFTISPADLQNRTKSVVTLPDVEIKFETWVDIKTTVANNTNTAMNEQMNDLTGDTGSDEVPELTVATNDSITYTSTVTYPAYDPVTQQGNHGTVINPAALGTALNGDLTGFSGIKVQKLSQIDTSPPNDCTPAASIAPSNWNVDENGDYSANVLLGSGHTVLENGGPVCDYAIIPATVMQFTYDASAEVAFEQFIQDFTFSSNDGAADHLTTTPAEIDRGHIGLLVSELHANPVRPLAGATVDVLGPKGESVATGLTTGANGIVDVEYLKPGQYTFKVQNVPQNYLATNQEYKTTLEYKRADIPNAQVAYETLAYDDMAKDTSNFTKNFYYGANARLDYLPQFDVVTTLHNLTRDGVSSSLREGVADVATQQGSTRAASTDVATGDPTQDTSDLIVKAGDFLRLTIKTDYSSAKNSAIAYDPTLAVNQAVWDLTDIVPETFTWGTHSDLTKASELYPDGVNETTLILQAKADAVVNTAALVDFKFRTNHSTEQPQPFEADGFIYPGHAELTVAEKWSNSERLIDGAQFELLLDGKRVDVSNDVTQKTVYSGIADNDSVLTTKADGKIVLDYLPAGHYTLRPISNPEGYTLDPEDPKDISFDIADYKTNPAGTSVTGLLFQFNYHPHFENTLVVCNLTRDDECAESEQDILVKPGDDLRYTYIINYPTQAKAGVNKGMVYNPTIAQATNLPADITIPEIIGDNAPEPNELLPGEILTIQFDTQVPEDDFLSSDFLLKTDFAYDHFWSEQPPYIDYAIAYRSTVRQEVTELHTLGTKYIADARLHLNGLVTADVVSIDTDPEYVAVEYLLPGDYYFTQTSVPAGYLLDTDKHWAFKVTPFDRDKYITAFEEQTADDEQEKADQQDTQQNGADQNYLARNSDDAFDPLTRIITPAPVELDYAPKLDISAVIRDVTWAANSEHAKEVSTQGGNTLELKVTVNYPAVAAGGTVNKGIVYAPLFADNIISDALVANSCKIVTNSDTSTSSSTSGAGSQPNSTQNSTQPSDDKSSAQTNDTQNSATPQSDWEFSGSARQLELGTHRTEFAQDIPGVKVLYPGDKQVITYQVIASDQEKVTPDFLMTANYVKDDLHDNVTITSKKPPNTDTPGVNNLTLGEPQTNANYQDTDALKWQPRASEKHTAQTITLNENQTQDYVILWIIGLLILLAIFIAMIILLCRLRNRRRSQLANNGAVARHKHRGGN